MLASCAVAAASGFLIYYYCDNEQESVSVVDAGRDYGMRSSAGAQSEAPRRSSRLQRTNKENEITAVPPSNRNRNVDTSKSRLTSQLSTALVSTDHGNHHEALKDNRASTKALSGSNPTWLSSRADPHNIRSQTTTSSRMETLQTARATLDQLRTARNDIDEASQRKGQGQVQANQTSKVTTDQLKTARNDGDEASHRKRRVVVYTKQTYQRNVQTSSSDPKALLKDSTRQSVRLIPLPIDNPQVHTMQKHMDTQIINGKQVNVEHRNEEMMKEDFRQHVLANSS